MEFFLAGTGDNWSNFPAPHRLEEVNFLQLSEDLDLKRLAREQSWQGFNERAFKRTIKDLEVEESPEELPALLKS